MEQNLKRSVGRGLSWSLVNTVTTRLGTFVLGIVLARLLTPDEFGVFAVALTVQIVLSMFGDLGLGAALVRSDHPDRLAPTVATLGLIWGSLLCGALWFGSSSAAELMGVPSAAPVIQLMSFTLLCSGIAVVPYSLLLRGFQQKKLLVGGISETIINAAVAVTLVKMGYGPLSLAIARIAAQGTSSFMLYFLAQWRPRFGFVRAEAGPALRFGIPAASATVLSMALINIDNVVVARVAGEAALGFYVLAFNVSNWPMSTLGQAIKSVSFAGYSESKRRRDLEGGASAERDRTLAVGVTFAWAAAAPVGLLLALLSGPLIYVLYGAKWSPSAAVLSALAAFGALRVVFMIIDDYILAHGMPRIVVLLQVVWMIALTPAMIMGTKQFGIAGGAWTHFVVAAIVMFPAYLLAARNAGAAVGAILRGLLPPFLAMVPCALVVLWLSNQFDGQPVWALLICSLAAMMLYALVLFRWLRGRWRSLQSGEAAPSHGRHRIPL